MRKNFSSSRWTKQFQSNENSPKLWALSQSNLRMTKRKENKSRTKRPLNNNQTLAQANERNTNTSQVVMLHQCKPEIWNGARAHKKQPLPPGIHWLNLFPSFVLAFSTIIIFFAISTIIIYFPCDSFAGRQITKGIHCQSSSLIGYLTVMR